MANFSRKHYDVIAAELNEIILGFERHEDRCKIEGVVEASWRMAEMFSRDNDRFVVRRFMQRVLLGTSVENHPLAA